MLRYSFIVLFALLGTAALAGSLTGKPAPAFELPDQYGEIHRLDDYRGKWLALYFYPKDDTPGCTTEACNFRDNIYAFRAIGAEVLGISLDDVNSHKKFSEKYKLPFRILSDTDGSTTEAYGAMRNLLVTRQARRESFLISPEGVIAKHYEKVDPDEHTQEVLDDLAVLMK